MSKGTNSNAKPVDVIAAMAHFLRHGREYIPHYNTPRSTGTIANAARVLRTGSGFAFASTPTTGTVLRALRRAEKAGDVVCVGDGREHNRAYNKSAATDAELYWRFSDTFMESLRGWAVSP